MSPFTRPQYNQLRDCKKTKTFRRRLCPLVKPCSLTKSGLILGAAGKKNMDPMAISAPLDVVLTNTASGKAYEDVSAPYDL